MAIYKAITDKIVFMNKIINKLASYVVFQLLLVRLCKVCFHTVVEGDELLHFQILLPPPKTNNCT